MDQIFPQANVVAGVLVLVMGMDSTSSASAQLQMGGLQRPGRVVAFADIMQL